MSLETAAKRWFKLKYDRGVKEWRRPAAAACSNGFLYRAPDANRAQLQKPERVIVDIPDGVYPKVVIMTEMTSQTASVFRRSLAPRFAPPYTTHGSTSCALLSRKRRGPSAPGSRSLITSLGYRSMPPRCHLFPFLYIFNFKLFLSIIILKIRQSH